LEAVETAVNGESEQTAEKSEGSMTTEVAPSYRKESGEGAPDRVPCLGLSIPSSPRLDESADLAIVLLSVIPSALILGLIRLAQNTPDVPSSMLAPGLGVVLP